MPTTLQGSDENDNVSSLPCCLKLLIDNNPPRTYRVRSLELHARSTVHTIRLQRNSLTLRAKKND